MATNPQELEEELNQPGDEEPEGEEPETEEPEADEGGEPEGSEGTPGQISQQQLVQAIGELANMVKSQRQDILEEIDRRLESTQRQAPKQDEPDPLDPNNLPDLESMDRRQLVQFIADAVSKRTEKMLQGVHSEVREVDNKTQKRMVEEEIEKAASQNQDFYEWTDEMRNIHRRYPNMTVTEAYKLARANDPTKAARMDAKYTKKTGGKKGGAQPSKEAGADGKKREGGRKSAGGYGGMPPGGSKTSQPSDMTREQAVEDAWNKTMANFEQPD